MTGEQIHVVPNAPAYKTEPLEFNLDNPSLNSDLFWSWVDVITRYPGAYLSHRFDFFRSAVSREPWGLWTPIFDAIYPNALGVHERTTTDSWYFEKVRSLSQRSWLFEALPYLILSAVMVLPVLVVAVRSWSWPLLLAAALYASGLLHMAGLFLWRSRLTSAITIG